MSARCPIARSTGIVVEAVATRVLDEVRKIDRSVAGVGYFNLLIHRARSTYALNAEIPELGPRLGLSFIDCIRQPDDFGRDWLYVFMRSWLVEYVRVDLPNVYNGRREMFLRWVLEGWPTPKRKRA